jgi:hypothetical protein
MGDVNMKKEEYTHIRVSKDLHVVLKREAETKVMSIANYIADLISRTQAIEALISGDSNVNMSIDTKKKLQNGLNCNKKMLRRGFEPRSWAREARMLGRTTPAEL